MSNMTTVRAATVDHRSTLLKGQPILSPSPLTVVNALREKAQTTLNALSMPTLRDEAWRFTDLGPLHLQTFQPVLAISPLKPDNIALFRLDESVCKLVFIDGIYAPQLSNPSSEGNVLVTDLPTAMITHSGLMTEHLGRQHKFADNFFVSFNTAFLQEVAVVVVPRHVALSAPVHLLFVATHAGTLSHPRSLVLVETGSHVTLVEDYVSLQNSAYWVNPVTEIVLAEHAQLTHVRVQRDGQQAFHIGNCAVSVGRFANYQSVSIDLGARLSRYNLSVVLEEGAKCEVDGLAQLDGRQVADTHSYIEHAKPQGTSRQMHKCIADDNAHAVFNGKVVVRSGAQQTDSAQSSRNLLLSGRAQIDTQPQLEIFADDVKCTHGATVGQLDAEEIFYLQSRGLSDMAARKLLTYAFGAEIIERIPVPSLKQQLQKHLLAQTGLQP